MYDILLKFVLLVVINLWIFTVIYRQRRVIRLQAANAPATAANAADTPFMKYLLFFLGVVTFEVQVLLPEFTNAIKFLRIGSSHPPSVADSQREIPFVEQSSRGNDLIIHAGTRENPNYHIGVNGYDVGHYDFREVAGAEQLFDAICTDLNDFFSAGIDSNVSVDIVITGQADNIPCLKSATFNGQDPIYGLKCFSRVSGKTVIRTFIPRVTIMVNEDFGRLRAHLTGEYWTGHLAIPNAHLHLESGISNRVGPDQRKVEIKVTIRNGLKYNVQGRTGLLKTILHI